MYFRKILVVFLTSTSCFSKQLLKRRLFPAGSENIFLFVVFYSFKNILVHIMLPTILGLL